MTSARAIYIYIEHRLPNMAGALHAQQDVGTRLRTPRFFDEDHLIQSIPHDLTSAYTHYYLLHGHLSLFVAGPTL
mgnify:CR=1 FL=1